MSETKWKIWYEKYDWLGNLMGAGVSMLDLMTNRVLGVFYLTLPEEGPELPSSLRRILKTNLLKRTDDK